MTGDAYVTNFMFLCRKTKCHSGLTVHSMQDVQSQRSFGIHCCTFNMTDEPLDEPPQLLTEAVKAADLPPDAFVTLQHGAMLQTANGVDLQSPVTMR